MCVCLLEHMWCAIHLQTLMRSMKRSCAFGETSMNQAQYWASKNYKCCLRTKSYVNCEAQFPFISAAGEFVRFQKAITLTYADLCIRTWIRWHVLEWELFAIFAGNCLEAKNDCDCQYGSAVAISANECCQVPPSPFFSSSSPNIAQSCPEVSSFSPC